MNFWILLSFNFGYKYLSPPPPPPFDPELLKECQWEHLSGCFRNFRAGSVFPSRTSSIYTYHTTSNHWVVDRNNRKYPVTPQNVWSLHHLFSPHNNPMQQVFVLSPSMRTLKFRKVSRGTELTQLDHTEAIVIWLPKNILLSIISNYFTRSLFRLDHWMYGKVYSKIRSA